MITTGDGCGLFVFFFLLLPSSNTDRRRTGVNWRRLPPNSAAEEQLCSSAFVFTSPTLTTTSVVPVTDLQEVLGVWTSGEASLSRLSSAVTDLGVTSDVLMSNVSAAN